MKVLHDFAGFLRNGSNKEMLSDLIQQSIEEDRANLEDRTVYFSNKKICTMSKEDQVTVLPNLNSDHKEADTKLVALVCAANVPSCPQKKRKHSLEMTVSSFFWKEKSAFWKLALKKHEFLQLFGKLGLEFRVNQQLLTD